MSDVGGYYYPARSVVIVSRGTWGMGHWTRRCYGRIWACGMVRVCLGMGRGSGEHSARLPMRERAMQWGLGLARACTPSVFPPGKIMFLGGYDV